MTTTSSPWLSLRKLAIARGKPIPYRTWKVNHERLTVFSFQGSLLQYKNGFKCLILHYAIAPFLP
ncbi:MAG: hypothetical protein QNJ72_38095, partial [Pleurocapsa sp. MO_226.B13]|nr:hypothetical protein [Pleurocapsa sp. MO_226.B13]